jgi:hypothetical protein
MPPHARSCSPHLLPLPPGLPPNDPDTLCNTTRGSCYLRNSSSLTYANAVAHCQRLGGAIVGYTSAAEQLEVETSIGSPASYWLGISRVSGYLHDQISRTDTFMAVCPYAHGAMHSGHGV